MSETPAPLSNKARALVTGASSGIGRWIAFELAARGYAPILVARRREGLLETADMILRQYGFEPELCVGDLLDSEFLNHLSRTYTNDGSNVQVLVNNAGFGMNQPFRLSDPNRLTDLIQLDLTVPIQLSRHFAEVFVSRGSGFILNVSSIAGFFPTPYHATYSATKAALTIFSESLDLEVRPSGVSVTCLCPGVTDTEFFEAGHYTTTSPVYRMKRASPRDVARLGVNALFARRRTVVPGLANHLLLLAGRLVPLRVITTLGARLMCTEPGTKTAR